MWGFFHRGSRNASVIPHAPHLPVWAASPESKRIRCTAPSWLECSQEKTIPFCRVGNICIYLGENCLGAQVYSHKWAHPGGKKISSTAWDERGKMNHRTGDYIGPITEIIRRQKVEGYEKCSWSMDIHHTQVQLLMREWADTKPSTNYPLAQKGPSHFQHHVSHLSPWWLGRNTCDKC